MDSPEQCRALAKDARMATLATIAVGPHAGAPYASLVLVAWDARTRPILLLSSLAEHTKNLQADARASLLVVGKTREDDPLAAERMTFVGSCSALCGTDADEARTVFLAAHPEAAEYAKLRDFRMYRFEPTAIRWIGGFGRQAWVSTESLAGAR